MKKQIKNKKLKEQICENLEGIKEFEIMWREEIEYTTKVKAKDEEEAEELFSSGDYPSPEINDAEFIDDSMEIFEL